MEFDWATAVVANTPQAPRVRTALTEEKPFMGDVARPERAEEVERPQMHTEQRMPSFDWSTAEVDEKFAYQITRAGQKVVPEEEEAFDLSSVDYQEHAEEVKASKPDLGLDDPSIGAVDADLGFKNDAPLNVEEDFDLQSMHSEPEGYEASETAADYFRSVESPNATTFGYSVVNDEAANVETTAFGMTAPAREELEKAAEEAGIRLPEAKEDMTEEEARREAALYHRLVTVPDLTENIDGFSALSASEQLGVESAYHNSQAVARPLARYLSAVSEENPFSLDDMLQTNDFLISVRSRVRDEATGTTKTVAFPGLLNRRLKDLNVTGQVNVEKWTVRDDPDEGYQIRLYADGEWTGWKTLPSQSSRDYSTWESRVGKEYTPDDQEVTEDVETGD